MTFPERIKREDVIFLRPALQESVSPYDCEQLFEKKLTKTKYKGEMLSHRDIT